MDIQIVDFISKVGFPMFVALYFMTTVTKVLQQNTQAIGELTSTNVQILNRLERLEKNDNEKRVG